MINIKGIAYANFYLEGGEIFLNWVMQLLELASSDHIEQARMLKIQGRGDRAGEKARRR